MSCKMYTHQIHDQLTLHVAAVDHNNKVWVWDGTDTDPSGLSANIPSELNGSVGIKKIDFINNIMPILYVIDENDKLYIWGDNSSGHCDIPTGLVNENLKEVAVSDSNVGVLDQDGKVWIWGDNSSGQCDIPTGITATDAGNTGNSCLTMGYYRVACKNSIDKVVIWGNYDNDFPTSLRDPGVVNKIEFKDGVSIIHTYDNNVYYYGDSMKSGEFNNALTYSASRSRFIYDKNISCVNIINIDTNELIQYNYENVISSTKYKLYETTESSVDMTNIAYINRNSLNVVIAAFSSPPYIYKPDYDLWRTLMPNDLHYTNNIKKTPFENDMGLNFQKLEISNSYTIAFALTNTNNLCIWADYDMFSSIGPDWSNMLDNIINNMPSILGEKDTNKKSIIIKKI